MFGMNKTLKLSIQHIQSIENFRIHIVFKNNDGKQAPKNKSIFSYKRNKEEYLNQ